MHRTVYIIENPNEIPKQYTKFAYYKDLNQIHLLSYLSFKTNFLI